MERLPEDWIETDTSMDTVSSRGKSLRLRKVRTLKNQKTGEIRLYPFELMQAEINQLAETVGVYPRDVPTMLILFAQPSYFKGGEVLYKYHLQKMLFYFWKFIGLNGYEHTIPIDKFEAAKNGPKPECLDTDLARLEEQKLVKVKCESNEYGRSKRITLTIEGTAKATEIWNALPNEYREIAVKVKERIYPLTPERVRHLVHNEYPEYKNTYTENDIE